MSKKNKTNSGEIKKRKKYYVQLLEKYSKINIFTPNKVSVSVLKSLITKNERNKISILIYLINTNCDSSLFNFFIARTHPDILIYLFYYYSLKKYSSVINKFINKIIERTTLDEITFFVKFFLTHKKENIDHIENIFQILSNFSDINFDIYKQEILEQIRLHIITPDEATKKDIKISKIMQIALHKSDDWLIKIIGDFINKNSLVELRNILKILDVKTSLIQIFLPKKFAYDYKISPEMMVIFMNYTNLIERHYLISFEKNPELLVLLSETIKIKLSFTKLAELCFVEDSMLLNTTIYDDVRHNAFAKSYKKIAQERYQTIYDMENEILIPDLTKIVIKYLDRDLLFIKK